MSLDREILKGLDQLWNDLDENEPIKREDAMSAIENAARLLEEYIEIMEEIKNLVRDPEILIQTCHQKSKKLSLM
jgi:hypothetical protein